jgi:predicted ribosome quality control (RQC) complex YloA/Tae2 family protein
MVSTKGIWITNKKYKQVEETQFTNVISREIERAKINSVSQPGSERIYFLHFAGRDDKVRILVVEIFGKGNFILCDEAMKIIWILNSIEVRHRTLKTGLQYTLPPNRGEDVLQISLEGIARNLSQVPENTEVAKWLGKSTSLPRKYVDEIISESGIDGKLVDELSNEDIEIIYQKTKELTNRVLDEKNHEPSVTVDDSGVAIDASPISMSKESNSY